MAWWTDGQSADFGQPGGSLCRDEKEGLRSSRVAVEHLSPATRLVGWGW